MPANGSTRCVADLGFEILATSGTAKLLQENGVQATPGLKVYEGRPNIVHMIKNNEIVMVINTVEDRRNAIADSRAIRTSALQGRVTTFTTIAGAAAAAEGMAFLDNSEVISLQEMHAALKA